MIFEFSPEAHDHLMHWQRRDRAKVTRIKALMQSIEEDPFKGIGKPEPLRQELSGWWSRRIDQEHRFVYRVHAGVCLVRSCRFHYDK